MESSSDEISQLSVCEDNEYDNIIPIGAKVFAKIDGYPYWPAQVIDKLEGQDQYTVLFYGTHQTSIVKHTRIKPYNEETTEKLIPPPKSKWSTNKNLAELYKALGEIEAGVDFLEDEISDNPAEEVNQVNSGMSTKLPAKMSPNKEKPTKNKQMNVPRKKKNVIQTQGSETPPPLLVDQTLPLKIRTESVTEKLNTSQKSSESPLNESSSSVTPVVPLARSRTGRTIKPNPKFADEEIITPVPVVPKTPRASTISKNRTSISKVTTPLNVSDIEKELQDEELSLNSSPNVGGVKRKLSQSSRVGIKEGIVGDTMKNTRAFELQAQASGEKPNPPRKSDGPSIKKPRTLNIVDKTPVIQQDVSTAKKPGPSSARISMSKSVDDVSNVIRKVVRVTPDKPRVNRFLPALSSNNPQFKAQIAWKEKAMQPLQDRIRDYEKDVQILEARNKALKVVAIPVQKNMQTTPNPSQFSKPSNTSEKDEEKSSSTKITGNHKNSNSNNKNIASIQNTVKQTSNSIVPSTTTTTASVSSPVTPNKTMAAIQNVVNGKPRIKVVPKPTNMNSNNIKKVPPASSTITKSSTSDSSSSQPATKTATDDSKSIVESKDIPVKLSVNGIAQKREENQQAQKILPNINNNNNRKRHLNGNVVEKDSDIKENGSEETKQIEKDEGTEIINHESTLNNEPSTKKRKTIIQKPPVVPTTPTTTTTITVSNTTSNNNVNKKPNITGAVKKPVPQAQKSVESMEVINNEETLDEKVRNLMNGNKNVEGVVANKNIPKEEIESKEATDNKLGTSNEDTKKSESSIEKNVTEDEEKKSENLKETPDKLKGSPTKKRVLVMKKPTPTQASGVSKLNSTPSANSKSMSATTATTVIQQQAKSPSTATSTPPQSTTTVVQSEPTSKPSSTLPKSAASTPNSPEAEEEQVNMIVVQKALAKMMPKAVVGRKPKQSVEKSEVAQQQQQQTPEVQGRRSMRKTEAPSKFKGMIINQKITPSLVRPVSPEPIEPVKTPKPTKPSVSSKVEVQDKVSISNGTGPNIKKITPAPVLEVPFKTSQVAKKRVGRPPKPARTSMDTSTGELDEETIRQTIQLKEETQKLSEEECKEKINQLEERKDRIDLVIDLMESASLDEYKCEEAYDLLVQLGSEGYVDAEFLKECPETVDVVKKMRHYVGNPKTWKMNKIQREQLELTAGKIREAADATYEYFKSLFQTNTKPLAVILMEQQMNNMNRLKEMES